MNRRLMISLTALLLSLCSLFILLFLFAFFSALVDEPPIIKQVDVFSSVGTQTVSDISLSPSKVVVSGITSSTEIELEPIFIAPNWREALPTASKIPTIMSIVRTTPTIKTVAIATPSVTSSPIVATITPSLKPTSTNTVSIQNPTEEPIFVDQSSSSTPTAIDSPTQLVTEASPLPSFTPSASATITLLPATATPVPSEPPTTLPTATAVPSETPTTAPTAPSVPSTPLSDELPNVPSISDLTYQAMFQHVGAQYNMNWRLLASIAYSESSLNPTAVGKDGEQGLMQILPSTWDEFAPRVGVSDPFDPVSNVQVGTAYLAYLRERLIKKGYPEEYWALVAYNWGPNNLARLLQADGNWGGIPIIRQDYAYKIIEQITESNNEWLENKLQERVY